MNVKEIYRTVRNAVLSVPIALTLAVAPVYAGDVGKKADYDINKEIQRLQSIRYLEPVKPIKNISAVLLGKGGYRFVKRVNGKWVFDLVEYANSIKDGKAIGKPIENYRIPEEFLIPYETETKPNRKIKRFYFKNVPGIYRETTKNSLCTVHSDYLDTKVASDEITLSDYNQDGIVDRVQFDGNGKFLDRNYDGKIDHVYSW